jgi:GGDEF domain-containing protein
MRRKLDQPKGPSLVTYEFHNKILELLSARVLTLNQAEKTLGNLHNNFPNSEIHRLFFHLLTNLTFNETEAQKHWKGLSRYHCSMQKQFNTILDLRISALAYFLQVCKKFRSPKFIELKLYMRNQNQLLTDELTGLYNFRFFKETLPREITRCQNNKSELSLALLDIDNFKQVNDRYGHLVGDDVLINSANVIKKAVGDTGLVFRYGGEEIAIIFPEVDKKSAYEIVDRVRQKYE